MDFQAFKSELKDFYWNKIDDMAEEFHQYLFSILDLKCTDVMNGYQRKALQYRTIAEECTPVLLHTSPFYHELGTISKLCDGCGTFHDKIHAGAWNYRRSMHMFEDQDPELYAYRNRQGANLLYLICGPYADTQQHFIFNCKPLFRAGLKGLCEKAKAQAVVAKTEEEKDFLNTAIEGLFSLRSIAEKFSACASGKLASAKDSEEIRRLERIRDASARTPWNAPETFYEALNLLAFIRTACGALEGIGYNTFGRPDVELLPFYLNDIASGILTKEDAYDLVKAFLLTWDCHYDHDMKMVGYSDHELENTYVLGGCDAYGKPVWNDLTEMFLRATREEKIIFPKITVRYGKNSPKEFLDAVDEDVIRGTSAVLYQNDDETIPSLIQSGRSVEDARDYLISGCWSLLTNGDIMDDHGNYINILKPFEMALHNRYDKMAECGLLFHTYDSVKSFEEFYQVTLENCRIVFRERNRMTHLGKGIWPKVDPLPLTSASMAGCLESMKDLTNGGCKYHDETYLCVGFPNVVDSLLAVKTLCFDEKRYTPAQMLEAVRTNWEGQEIMRKDAMLCAGWGDGSEEARSVAGRFNHDLYEAVSELKPLWLNGRINMGHITYTEIRFWAENILATPDGRRNGEYFSQGLTPSRLKKIDSVTSVINSFSAISRNETPGNTVVNIILPSARMTLDTCEAFLRVFAHSSLMTLQLNCVTKEELLDAQIHPENHRDLIVRVCGFSARFTSLSPEWQKEVLTRNFYR